MPELPEVETVRRAIEPHLLDQRIVAVHATVDKLRHPLAARELLRHVKDRRIAAVRRRGKYLIVECEEKRALLLHLGMTGALHIDNPGEPLDSHDRLLLRLSGGMEIRFHDPRRFGECRAVRLPASGGEPEELAHLGPEPLGEDFDAAYLYAITRKRTRAIKPLLMDATLVVGVGNIYASEALFRAGIRPTRRAGRIGREACARLAAHVKAVLLDAIAMGGTTLSDYRRPDGSEGRFRIALKVYGREGEHCKACRATIKRLVQTGRSSYYCPRCQR